LPNDDSITLTEWDVDLTEGAQKIEVCMSRASVATQVSFGAVYAVDDSPAVPVDENAGTKCSMIDATKKEGSKIVMHVIGVTTGSENVPVYAKVYQGGQVVFSRGDKETEQVGTARKQNIGDPPTIGAMTFWGTSI